jgi:S-(hydroxymethyl)glutathione dehydrogenase/alcohol dehydrogenase
VGLNVIQGAKLCGARSIVAVDVNPDKESEARHAGATHFLNPNASDVGVEVKQLTRIGADYAFDTVGTMAVLRQALASLHDGGYARMVRIAVDTDPEAPIHLAELGNKRFSSTLMGGAKRQDVAQFADWFVKGKLQLDKLVSHRLPLERIEEGFDLMRRGQSNRVVIEFTCA